MDYTYNDGDPAHVGQLEIEFDFIPRVNALAGDITLSTESQRLLPDIDDSLVFDVLSDGSAEVGVSGIQPLEASNVTSSVTGFTSGSVLHGNLSFTMSNMALDSDTGLFYPDLNVLLQAPDESFTAESGGAGVPYGTLSVDSILNTDIVGPEDLGTTTLFYDNIVAVITPLEYWPYATIGGDPVYDTSSGAQLNDPLS